MARLGPFGPAPRLAVAVSGGPDSMALALLAAAWARDRGGAVRALVVDHGLRPEAAREARETVARMAPFIDDATVLSLGLTLTTAIAAQARARRYEALTAECARAGIPHLLLGHHKADQAETVIIRALGGSGPAGLAGMAALAEGRIVRLLRPLLEFTPGDLQEFLRRRGMEWVDDPSNRSATAQRGRVRTLRADAAGRGPATRALAEAAMRAGQDRAVAEEAAARWIARNAVLDPAGFALLPDGPWPPDVLAALVRTIAGRAYRPPSGAIAGLSAAPRAATLAGALLAPARRLGHAWVLSREPAAMASAVPARAGAVWDGRFRLGPDANLPEGATLGPLGADAARLRRFTPLPARILATLPAVRCNESLFAVPHIGYPSVDNCARAPLLFQPPVAAAGPRFLP